MIVTAAVQVWRQVLRQLDAKEDMVLIARNATRMQIVHQGICVWAFNMENLVVVFLC